MSDQTSNQHPHGAAALAAASAALASAAHVASAPEQAKADADALREREREAAQDSADIARAAAEQTAAAAQAAADNRQRIADQLASEAEGDGLEEIDLGQRRISVRAFGGGVRHYGPGKVRVPRSVADSLATAPTFARSGDPIADAQVRRRLERDHGITELVTTEESLGRSASGSEAHANAGGDDDSLDGGGRVADAHVREGGAAANRAETRRGRNKPDAVPMSKSAIAALGAEEVERRYEAGVKAGRVKPVKDGKGSGADGAVVMADRVDALADAGETE